MEYYLISDDYYSNLRLFTQNSLLKFLEKEFNFTTNSITTAINYLTNELQFTCDELELED